MKQFLSIILRNQFNLFYRFGYTFIPKCQLVEFDGKINNQIQESIIKQFKTVTPFEYDEEYLILHLEKEISNESDFIQFEIQDIVAVYPLSQQAKASIESRIDQRIRLEKPIFETLLPLIETEIENKEVEKAISALWKICKIESPLEKYIANIGLEKIFNGLEFRKHGTKANKIQNGNYWEYLIAYDRYDYFPNSTLGYFYDAGQVFAYSKAHPTFEGSGIHKFLEKLNSANPTIKLLDIINYLETEEQLKGYVSQTTTSDIKQYVVAPLYLMLRDEIRKSDDIAQTKLFKNLDYLKKFDDSFNYAVILLGAFFGFRKFYDNYYEALNLRFYKDFKEPQKQIKKENLQETVDANLETDESEKTLLEYINVTQAEHRNEEILTETKDISNNSNCQEDKNIEEQEESINNIAESAESVVVIIEGEDIKETQSEIRGVEDGKGLLSTEDNPLTDKIEKLAEENHAEIKIEDKSDSSDNLQGGKKEVISDTVSQYQRIIELSLEEKAEVSLKDIASMIKEKTGHKANNKNIENVAKQMKGIEIIKVHDKT